MSHVQSQSNGRWPTSTEYAVAVQNPQLTFSDPDLAAGQLTLTPLGLPASASGQNAVAFHFTTSNGPTAVRCLLSEHEDGRERYLALGHHLATSPIPEMVSARWIDAAIAVGEHRWPVVVMPWVDGVPIHDAAEDRLGEPARLMKLADGFTQLVIRMQAAGVTHGDLQHGNVLVTSTDEIRLVDLDGIWVRGITVGPPGEQGHPSYQHPHRNDSDWGPTTDSFSALTIVLSLCALAVDPSLRRFMTGENMLFTRDDFERSRRTGVWSALSAISDSGVADLTTRLKALAEQPQPPAMSLAELLAGDAITPIPSVTEPERTPSPTGAPPSGAWWEGNSSTPTATPRSWEDIAASPPTSTNPVQDTAQDSDALQPAHRSGLGHITGRPAVAGLVAGILGGLLGSLLGGAIQRGVAEPYLRLGLFLLAVTALIGAFINAWPGLNLGVYGKALRQMLIGAAAGLAAGGAALLVGDFVANRVLEPGDVVGQHVGLVVFLWALSGALLGTMLGVLRSWRAAVLGSAAGAVGGAFGGLIHGQRVDFVGGQMIVDGLEPVTFLLVGLVGAIIGLAVTAGMYAGRRGSLTVVDGPGQGSVITVDKANSSIGSGASDSLSLKVPSGDLPTNAIRISQSTQGTTLVADVEILLDGKPIAAGTETRLASGQVIGAAGVFVRYEQAESS